RRDQRNLIRFTADEIVEIKGVFVIDHGQRIFLTDKGEDIWVFQIGIDALFDLVDLMLADGFL
ncbi:hypothetical protein ACP3W2_28855, partial [Salmonella enterica]|uniref:hypothetical protein n=1 Tax=Salmonella enterica TaxID=28901 RepID=UPI003CF2355B